MNEDRCEGAGFLKASPDIAHQESPSHTCNPLTTGENVVT